jgi:hypothetical protein
LRTWFGGRSRRGGDATAGLTWLPAGHPDNPFGIEVLDCRAIADTMTSTTSDPAVAENFVHLRDSDGRELRGRLPEHATAIACALEFPGVALPAAGPVFVAPAMEHKWDVYCYDAVIYLRRSWTGHLGYAAEVTASSAGLRVVRLHAANLAEGEATRYALAEADFLLSAYVARQLVPFPIPPDLPRHDPQAIAMAGWSLHGRLARYARVLPEPS